jgi:4-hydroxy-tetrahydrodipicolinate synthase
VIGVAKNVQRQYSGIIPAIPVPFLKSMEIDEIGLRRLAKQLAETGEVVGLLTNGHTGEIFALSPDERATVTRIVADELAQHGDLPVISAVSCEGISDAVLHAVMAKDAGARAVMLMPPHHWLRFGHRPGHVLDYFDAVAEAVGIDLFVHVYPAWTRASYSSDLLAALARKPYIKVFKLGTRDMNKYARDIAAIRAADSTKAILTCHDEYLLPSMVQGVDGALVGFGSFLPKEINALFQAVQRGDLQEAQRIQTFINPLKDVVYGSGEPTGDAHSRLKEAMRVAGMIENATPRPPTTEPDKQEKEQIRGAVEAAGLARLVTAHA